MSKTLMEIMEPEINERIRNRDCTNLYLYVQDGDMMLENTEEPYSCLYLSLSL